MVMNSRRLMGFTPRQGSQTNYSRSWGGSAARIAIKSGVRGLRLTQRIASVVWGRRRLLLGAHLRRPPDVILMRLGKDAPLGRDIERSVTIVITPTLSGRHHCYARI